MITICTATLVLASTGRPLRRAGLKRQSRTARTTGSVSAGKPLITSTDATRPSAATLTRTTTVPPWKTNGEIFASTVVSGTGSSKPDSCTGDDAAVAPTTKSEANRTARRRPGVESIGETPKVLYGVARSKRPGRIGKQLSPRFIAAAISAACRHRDQDDDDARGVD